MAHVCPKCGDRMAWVPEWDYDYWRCKVCGLGPAIRAEKSGEPRIVELSQGFCSEDVATRDKVKSLFRESASPLTLHRILDAQDHLGPTYRREMATERRRGCIQIGVDALSWLWQLTFVFGAGFFLRTWSDSLFDFFTGSDPEDVRTPSGDVLAGLTRAASEVMSCCDGAAFAGAVACAILSPRLRANAMAKLPALSEGLTREDGKRLTAPELAALTRLLESGWAPAPPTDQVWEVVIAACRIMSFTDHEPALGPMRRLADAWWGLMRSVPPRVRAVARQSAEPIERRVAELREQSELLRPATPSADTDSLLRPASAGEEPPEQLLRAERTDDQ